MLACEEESGTKHSPATGISGCYCIARRLGFHFTGIPVKG